jgi:hypothetical protein
MENTSTEGQSKFIGIRVPVFVFNKVSKKVNGLNISISDFIRSVLYPAIGIDSPEVINISKRYGEWAKDMLEENQEQRKGEYIGIRVTAQIFNKVTEETSRLGISMSNFMRSLIYPSIGINSPEDMKKLAREYKDSIGEVTIEKIGEKISHNILLKDMEATFAECLAIATRKNNDYAGEKTTDPFANFRASEILSGVKVERGILVRMGDKFKRVSNLLDQDNAVKDESISDTLSDIINYSAILQSYLKNNKKKPA